jgi:TonB family protein
MKFFFILLLLPVFSIAQDEPEPYVNGKVYDYVEDDPQYPGGMEVMNEYIANSIQYPDEALKKREQGIVYVKFVVGADGVVKNVGVRKGVSTALDNEAERVVSGMPKWIPGEQNGEKVAVNFTVPIRFILPKDSIRPVPDEIIYEIVDDGALEVPEPIPGEQVYDFVEEDAKYTGGESRMAEFIQNNVEYPDEAIKNGEQGIVYVKFIIEKDGSITNVGIRKGVYESLNAEAIRVVKKMPNWIPAKQKGEPVRINYTLPIHFRLAADAPEVPAVPLTEKEQKEYDKKVKKAEKVKAKYLKKREKEEKKLQKSKQRPIH